MSISHVPCQSALPFLRYSIFKIQPWKSMVKVMGEGKVESHNMGPTFYRLTYLSFHVNPPSHSWDTTFSKFDLSWKSKVKVMVEIKVDSHKVGVTSYRFTSLLFHVNQHCHSWDTAFSKFDLENPRSRSWVRVESHNMGAAFYRLTSLSFHVNWTSHTWDTAFSKFDLENPRSRSWVRWTLKVTTWVQHSIDSHPFNSMSIRYPIPEIRLFQNLTLKIKSVEWGGWETRVVVAREEFWAWALSSLCVWLIRGRVAALRVATRSS